MPDPSPLSTTSPDALTSLFLSDPLSLSDADYTSLISEIRRRRDITLATEAAKAAKGKTPRMKPSPNPSAAASLDKPTAEVDLGDLGL